jgi:hypothetical protein
MESVAVFWSYQSKLALPEESGGDTFKFGIKKGTV